MGWAGMEGRQNGRLERFCHLNKVGDKRRVLLIIAALSRPST
jgi:hypothetical protein